MQYHNFSKLVAGIYRRSKNNFNRRIESLDVRATQSDLIMFIYEHPGLQQNQIAQEMSIDNSLLVRDLKVLSQKKLITRKPLETDRRANIIELTQMGSSVAKDLTATMDEWWSDLFSELPNVKADPLDEQLSDIYQALIKRDETA